MFYFSYEKVIFGPSGEKVQTKRGISQNFLFSGKNLNSFRRNLQSL